MAETALKLGPRFFVMAKKKNLVRLRIKDEGEAYYFKYPYNPYAVVKYRIDDPAAGEPIK